MSDPLPCPVCGKPPRRYLDGGSGHYIVECDGSTPEVSHFARSHHRQKDSALNNWNEMAGRKS